VRSVNNCDWLHYRTGHNRLVKRARLSPGIFTVHNNNHTLAEYAPFFMPGHALDDPAHRCYKSSFSNYFVRFQPIGAISVSTDFYFDCYANFFEQYYGARNMFTVEAFCVRSLMLELKQKQYSAWASEFYVFRYVPEYAVAYSQVLASIESFYDGFEGLSEETEMWAFAEMLIFREWARYMCLDSSSGTDGFMVVCTMMTMIALLEGRLDDTDYITELKDMICCTPDKEIFDK